MKFSAAALLFAALFLVARPSGAEVYMLKDSRGVVFFTDHLPENPRNFTVLKKYGFQGQKGGVVYRSPGGRGPIFTTNYDSLINAAGSRHGIDPRLIRSVIKVESNFNRYARSSKGAMGLMQLMPDTARLVNVSSPYEPDQNINGGARYLRMMMNEFGGNLRLAVAAYNAGPEAVKRYRGVPPYRETVDYVSKVLYHYSSVAGRIGMSDAVVTTSLPVASDDANAQSGYKKPRKAVFYTYKNGSGEQVFTDRPVGKKRVLVD
ncbi:MAG: lytic transglycosylase domain-containing protein [Nitrospinae bacterium]|nr:lytic transglycosylase domain-containing protein [Nitrospinota bacterium]